METSIQPLSTWGLFQKTIFRFVFAYFLLYTIPFPLDMVPGLGGVAYELTESVWDKVVPWFGEEVLGTKEITIKPAGSGDTTWNYVQLLLMVLLAAFMTLIWSILDRKRINYERLYYWSIVFMRYYLAFVLMGYGFAKVFKSQFPEPGLMSLMQPFGDSSPMGLAWNFVGYSFGFNLFTGLGEAIAGFLLLFRRTKVLGGFMGIAVMSNIVVMNYCYDIPVKLFSTNLLLMIFFVLAPDFKRILNFLIFNKAVIPTDLSSHFTNAKLNKAALVLKILIIGYSFYGTYERYSGPQEWGDRAPKPALYGIYDVQNFAINRDTLPPLMTDDRRWKNMVINWKNNAAVIMMPGNKKYYGFVPDTVSQTIKMYNYRDSANQNTILEYARPTPDSLVIKGIWINDTLDIQFTRRDKKDFLLMNRGFHWINEYPFNR